MSMSPTMGGERALLDASSYMLVEASGDSESEYYHTVEQVESTAEDDAESCSCGFFSDTSAGAREIIDGGCRDDFLDTDFDDCVEDDGGGGCGCGAAEAEDGVVDQCGGGGGAAAELNNSKGREDSNMSEKEMDRLFWEACLAS